MIIFPIAIFIFIWLIISHVLSRIMGLKWSPEINNEIDYSTDSCLWTSGNINGVACNNCLNLFKVNDGFIIGMMALFSLKKRKINNADIISIRHHKNWFGKWIEIDSKYGKICFSGRGLKFIERHYKDKMMA